MLKANHTSLNLTSPKKGSMNQDCLDSDSSYEPPIKSKKLASLSIDQELTQVKVDSNNQENMLENTNMSKQSFQRYGKWTTEEEEYTSRLIQDFIDGNLSDIADGTTMRSWLSTKLYCCPMRISKKFVGKSSIGKKIYSRNKKFSSQLAPEEQENRQKDLKLLEENFIKSWKNEEEAKDIPPKSKPKTKTDKSFAKSTSVPRSSSKLKAGAVVEKKSSLKLTGIKKKIYTLETNCSYQRKKSERWKKCNTKNEESFMNEMDFATYITDSSSKDSDISESQVKQDKIDTRIKDTVFETEQGDSPLSSFFDSREKQISDLDISCLERLDSPSPSNVTDLPDFKSVDCGDNSFDLSIMSARGEFLPVMDDLTASPVSVFDFLVDPALSSYQSVAFDDKIMLSNPNITILCDDVYSSVEVENMLS